ncbi:BAG family molecular chaperone regulator 5, mitochondrial [Cynara cardunculus var. scolymus]|uniref:BAG domain-containing protein n=1 Tax=Cynara cardunculus var. scolymus TaxID=59895 RepID=A0A103XU64_CYNCS|nr:BAG family molecular chaperone regulator 5, mitochondrial [Cynara cardunculus var. scolymus]KVH96900.1 BAG domain-containing protein [Cynara cardunculus var. scolymus]
MKSSCRIRSCSSADGATTTNTFKGDNSQTNSTEIPITFHLSNHESTAAVKIQSAYRSHAIRNLTNKIKAVNSEADKLQRLIQLQETVDAVRTNNRDRIKMNEALMRLLFTLDSVPGLDPTVREFRRNVSRRIVGLQEILDSICEAGEANWDGFLRDWDDVIMGIEHEICKEKGGADSHEFERFCAENLGFQCLQRFLRQ